MQTLKKLGKALLFPHIAIMAALIPLAVSLLAYAFLVAGSESPIAYASYVIAFYTLSVWCVRIPRLISFIKRIKTENRLARRISDDAQLRVKISLYGSVALNLAYAVLQFALGLLNHSFWFHSLAIYYLLLVIMRAFLIRGVNHTSPGENMVSELKRYRFCGIILLITTQALASMTFFITFFNRGFAYGYITTIALAAFTFTSLTVAVVNVVRYRRYNSPLFSASKAIAFASALVSMLTLETAMFSAFGGTELTPSMRAIFTSITGIVVSMVIIAMAIYMIVRATKQLHLFNDKRIQDDIKNEHR